MDAPVSRLERARLDILQLRLDEEEDLWRSVDGALRVSATTLGVARVGVWFLTPGRTSLYRARLYDVSAAAPADDLILPLDQWPAYLEAITVRRVVAAHDARVDPRTCELAESYLVPLGIGSLLDAPLFLASEVRGIVCHEHVGEPRTWTAHEIDFAASVADMLGALFEQSLRLSAERRLRASEAKDARSRQVTVAARAAAGVAHDVNTVLHAITTNVETARTAKDEATRATALATVLEDCRRSARFLAQLRELGEPVGIVDAIAPGEVIADMRLTLEALVGDRRLSIETTSAAHVSASRADLERILLNLVTNARDAASPGTAIEVSVRDTTDGVVLEVHDEGPGLDAATAARAFEPWFSAKGGEHAGLGLFLVEVMAERSGGVVSLTSEPGQGATFAVTWPPPREA